ncbi:hypothetical protein D3C86_1492580 [compost metagenome]
MAQSEVNHRTVQVQSRSTVDITAAVTTHLGFLSQDLLIQREFFQRAGAFDNHVQA